MTGRLLTARAVADMLGVSAETVLRWHRRGEFEGVVVPLPGGAIRFREDELDRWLTERAAPGRGVVEHPAGRRPRPSVHSIMSSTPEDEE
jgi:excisionase family DNA binding protein